MSKVETTEEFCQRKYDWIPFNCENLGRIVNTKDRKEKNATFYHGYYLYGEIV